tara:strand:+ start:93 stop:485 length:393 start_codon:yes stop_codon:yes gene_type:complete
MSGISDFISKLFWLMIFILLSLIIATLVGSNSQLTTLRLWPIQGQLTVALWLPILLSFATGLIIGGLLIWLKSNVFYRVTRQMRKQKKNNLSIKQTIEDDSYLLFEQTATSPPLNGEKGKQTLTTFTQGS